MPTANDVEKGTHPERSMPHAGPSSQGTKNFSHMLYHAAFNDSDSKKVVPLFAEVGANGGPTLRIRTMQHMTITHLRRKLAVLAEDMMSSKTATETQMDRVQTTLKEYVSALRDLKYMLEIPSKDPSVAKFLKDLLYLDASSINDLTIMLDTKLIKEHPSKPRLHVSNYTGEGGNLNRSDNRQRLKEGLLNRIRIALFGGVVVVAPMLIMTLHRTLLTALLTTSLFVLAVSLILAWSMDSAQPKDILTATAAYAAILVVFVGTTLPA